MWLIEELGFPLAHKLKLVALQGDCAVQDKVESSGGRYAIDNADRARLGCLSLIESARTEQAHLALIPEMAIPKQAVPDLIHAIQSSSQPLVVIGGLEGIPPADYRELVTQHGGTPDVPVSAQGTYVNAMIAVVRTATGLNVHFRGKRYGSGPENAGGPQLALSNGPFLILKLGSAPFVIVPLICSEFTWPDFWNKLNDEAPGLAVHVIPVLQRNDDVRQRYTGPAMHTAYQKNLQTRFVLVNQALLPGSDGTSFVVTPPGSPAAPGFDHGRQELWLPDTTYKGFRIPDRTGCFWYAEVEHPAGQMSAAKPHVCSGRVLAVLTPSDVDLGGLSAGLMRSAAAREYLESCKPCWANTPPKLSYQSSLIQGDSYLLNEATRSTADGAFFHMRCNVHPTWSTVEPLVDEFIETAALLACGGDRVRIVQSEEGNVTVSGRPVSLLYAPAVDAALETRFPVDRLLSGVPLPTGVVLLKVEASSRVPRGKTVGDVLRADRISSESPELRDGPVRVPASSVTINLGNIHFCEPPELRPGLDQATLAAARNRSSVLLPGVYL
jgi:hypothetical protein